MKEFIDQKSPVILKNIRNNEKVIIVSLQPGTPECTGYKQEKDDDEYWRIIYSGNGDYSDLEVDVSYTLGMHEPYITDVNVLSCPEGFIVEKSPLFEFKENESTNF